MMEYTTDNWTKEYVFRNKEKCIDTLCVILDKIAECLKVKDYHMALAGYDQLINGYIILQNSGTYNLRPFIATGSYQEGALIVYALDDAPDKGRRDTAIKCFLDAKDFSTGEIGNLSQEAIKLIESGQDFKNIKESMYMNFPDEFIEFIEDTKSRLKNLKSAGSYTTSKNSGGCYVATCVYGSYDCPQVWTLRRYRDSILAKSWYGRAFIFIYYAISPTIVKLFGQTEWFMNMWKPKLDSMVKKLKAEGVEDTPYEDRKW